MKHVINDRGNRHCWLPGRRIVQVFSHNICLFLVHFLRVQRRKKKKAERGNVIRVGNFQLLCTLPYSTDFRFVLEDHLAVREGKLYSLEGIVRVKLCTFTRNGVLNKKSP